MGQKTVPVEQTFESYLAALPDTQRRDAAILAVMMQRVSKSEPKIWTGNMIGFGTWHYKYKSGHSGYTFELGFAARKTGLTLYLSCGFSPLEEFSQLGKYTMSQGSCLYIKKLADVNLDVLEAIIAKLYQNFKAGNATS